MVDRSHSLTGTRLCVPVWDTWLPLVYQDPGFYFAHLNGANLLTCDGLKCPYLLYSEAAFSCLGIYLNTERLFDMTSYTKCHFYWTESNFTETVRLWRNFLLNLGTFKNVKIIKMYCYKAWGLKVLQAVGVTTHLMDELVKTPQDTLLPRWDVNSVVPSTVFPLSCVAETRTQGFECAGQGLCYSTGSLLWFSGHYQF